MKNILNINNIKYGFWACQRPLTKKWGSGQIFVRLSELMGEPDIAFGKTDNIPDSVFYVDKSNGYDWAKLPFKDNQFEFGYWDPPYDHLYKKEGMEIWRCCKKLAILHTYIWPRAWLKDSIRLAMVATTFGPMKQIRCLQIFKKEVVFCSEKEKRGEKIMGEHCQICGEEYGEKYGYIWTVSDKLWEKVIGIKDQSGLRCINCFSQEAEKKRIYIQWYGKEINV